VIVLVFTRLHEHFSRIKNGRRSSLLLYSRRPARLLRSTALMLFISKIRGVEGGSFLPLDVDIRQLFFAFIFFLCTINVVSGDAASGSERYFSSPFPKTIPLVYASYIFFETASLLIAIFSLTLLILLDEMCFWLGIIVVL